MYNRSMNKVILLSLMLLSVLTACAPFRAETPALSADTPQATPPLMATAPVEASALPVETLPAAPEAACSVPETWSLSFHRTGGFAGFDQSLTVKSQGELQVESKNPPLTFARALSPDELSQLTELLRQACPFNVSPGRNACADCFVYDLQIQWGNQAYAIQATDVTLPEEWRSLVGVLSMFFQGNAP